jgi:hypothetical protein
MNVKDWASLQDLLGEMQMKLGGPHDLMMFSVDTGDVTKQDIIIGLPDTLPARLFAGFESIGRETIPNYLTTLIVREDGMDELFPDIQAKRRSRFGAR